MDFEDRILLPSLGLIQRRPRLLDLLQKYSEVERSLIILDTPSGYGKSVLLVDFAQTIDLPVCWCSLKHTKFTPQLFLQVLVQSLSSRFHHLKSESLLQLTRQTEISSFIRHLTELLANVGPHLIIFDDYPLLTGSSSRLIFAGLLEILAETSRIIVTTQSKLEEFSYQTEDNLVSNPILYLSKEELRFTTEEIQALLRKQFGFRLEVAQAEAIQQLTDGNVAHILLTARIFCTRSGQTSQTWPENWGRLNQEYFAQEILNNQSVELRKFLLHTAVLPEISPGLANSLLEIETASILLEELVQKNLFISRSGLGYKYQQPFAEFLQATLAQDPEQYNQVSLRAARLMAAEERFAEALPLYISSQAWQEVADLLEKKGRFLLDTSQMTLLERWLKELPADVLQSRPNLVLLQAQIIVNHSHNDDDLELAVELFQQAELKFLEQGNLLAVAETYLTRSAGVRPLKDGHGVALRRAVEVLDQLIILNADDYLIAWAIQNRGVAYGEAGNLTAALNDIRQAKEMFEELDEKFQIGQCHQKIGVFLVGRGQAQEANYHFQQAINIWETLPNPFEMVNSLNSLGSSLIAMGSYNEAVSCLSRAFDLTRQIGFNKQSIATLLSMGDAYLGLNLLDKALEAYQRAATLAQEGRHQKFQILALIKVSACFYRQGQLVEAVKLTAQAKVMAGETEFLYERGLATMLQAKIHVAWAEYEPSFALFEEALTCFVNNHTLEQIKVRLWWGYSLLLDSRSSAAFEQLRQVISLVLATPDLQQGLSHAIHETQQFLDHFLYNRKTSSGMRNGIEFLLQQRGSRIGQSKPGLQFFAFGHPTLIVKGRRKNFVQRGRSRKLPEFLAYLLIASQNGGCRWDELSAAIWPDLETYSASARFHQSLKRLRNSILGQPDYTILQDDYYQINPACAQWCDAIMFDKLFDRIVQMPTGDSLDLQLELIDLYQGEFLLGFDLEEWAQLYRIQCEARFLRIVKMASEQLLKIGLPWKALMIAKKGLAQDFFREDLHANVLIAFARLGLRSEVERHFKTMCDTFERELISAPQYEIRDLYQQLTTQV